MKRGITVIEYVLGKIKELRVTDVFGVPGDFVYPVCDAVTDDNQLRWIGSYKVVFSMHDRHCSRKPLINPAESASL